MNFLLSQDETNLWRGKRTMTRIETMNMAKHVTWKPSRLLEDDRVPQRPNPTDVNFNLVAMLQVLGRIHKTPDTAWRTRHEDSPKKVQYEKAPGHIRLTPSTKYGPGCKRRSTSSPRSTNPLSLPPAAPPH